MRFAVRFGIVFIALAFVLPALADSAKSLYTKGQHAEASDNYEQAYDFFRQAYQQKPTDVHFKAAYLRTKFLAAASHVHKGQLMRDGGKLNEALAEFQQALAIDPASFIAEQEIKRTQKMIQETNAPPGENAPPPKDSVSRMIENATGPVELAPISQVPITLKVSEDAKRVYSTIGQLAGVNVLFDPDLTTRPISVELNGVTLDEALDIVALESRTFWRPVTPNTIFVAADVRNKRQELEQNVLKTFFLNNLNQPTELQEVVTALRGVLEITRLQAIGSQNAIVVRGTPAQVALAEKLINDFDKPPSEVVIDIAVMQVNRDKLRDLGLNPVSSGANPTATVSLNPNVNTSTTNTNTTTTGTTTSTGTTNGQINLNKFTHLNATDFTVTVPNVTLNLLYSDANTQIIQRPELRSSDGQKASLKIGNRIPVATGSFQPGIGGVGINPLVNTQFQYIDVGVNIDITPHVHSSGREVSLKMTLEISSVTNTTNIGGIQQPIIGQRKIDHEIRLKDGEINLIGGIFEDQDVKNLSGVPGLSQIPLFKYLFSENRTERTQNEIVFVLIPHIVRSLDLNQANLRPIEVGTGQAIDVRMRPVAANGGGPQGGANTQMGRGGATTAPGGSQLSGSQTPVSAPPRSVPAQQQNPATIQSPGGAQPAEPQPEATPNQAANAAQGQAAPQLPSQPGGTTLWFDPPNANVAVGGTVAVNIGMRGAQNLTSVSAQVKYDPAMLQLANVSNGTFLSRDGQVVVLTNRADPTTGTAVMTASRPPGAGGISGDGPVFTLTFVAKSGGRATLSFTRAGARDASDQAVQVSATTAQINVH